MVNEKNLFYLIIVIVINSAGSGKDGGSVSMNNMAHTKPKKSDGLAGSVDDDLIMRLTYAGLDSAEIGRFLGLNPPTITRKINTYSKKVGAHSRKEAAMLFVKSEVCCDDISSYPAELKASGNLEISSDVKHNYNVAEGVSYLDEFVINSRGRLNSEKKSKAFFAVSQEFLSLLSLCCLVALLIIALSLLIRGGV